MIHLFSSEFAAFLVFLVLLFSAVFLQRHYVRPDHRLLDTLTATVGGLLACRLVARGSRCQWPSGVDYRGRVALVVGASSGVGYSVAKELAEHGWTVILAGPDSRRLLVAKEKILKKVQRRFPSISSSSSSSSSLPSTPEVMVLGVVDLSSEQSVREYVAKVCAVQHRYPIALLVNAAGTLKRHLEYGKDGFNTIEAMMATNAVGPLLLTQLLLPALEQTAEQSSVSSRIVNVASSCHTFLGFPRRPYPKMDYPLQMLYGLERSSPDFVHSEKRKDGCRWCEEKNTSGTLFELKDLPPFNFVGYYGLSKLCVVWNTILLAQKVSNRYFSNPPVKVKRSSTSQKEKEEEKKASAKENQVNCLKVFVASCHPGIITTHLYRDLLPTWVLDYLIYYPSLLLGKTWDEGAQSALKLCVETDSMKLGGYYLCSGEYGADSGVSCVSSYGSSTVLAMEYGKWVNEHLTGK